MYFSSDDLHFKRAICSGYVRAPEYLRIGQTIFRCETRGGISGKLTQMFGTEVWATMTLEDFLAASRRKSDLQKSCGNWKKLVAELKEIDKMQKLVDEPGWVIPADPEERPYGIKIGDIVARVVPDPDTGHPITVQLYQYRPIAMPIGKNISMGNVVFTNEADRFGLNHEFRDTSNWWKWRAFQENVLWNLPFLDENDVENVTNTLKEWKENKFKTLVGYKIPMSSVQWYMNDQMSFVALGNDLPAGTRILHFTTAPTNTFRLNVFKVTIVGKTDEGTITSRSGVEWWDRTSPKIHCGSGYRTGSIRHWEFRLHGGDCEIYTMCRAEMDRKKSCGTSIRLCASICGVGFDSEVAEIIDKAWDEIKGSREFKCIMLPLRADIELGEKNYHMDVKDHDWNNVDHFFLSTYMHDAALFLEHKGKKYYMRLMGVRETRNDFQTPWRDTVG